MGLACRAFTAPLGGGSIEVFHWGQSRPVPLLFTSVDGEEVQRQRGPDMLRLGFLFRCG